MIDNRKIPDDLGSFFKNLEEPFLGVAKPREPAADKRHVCLECNGTGKGQRTQWCPACKGKGWFTLGYKDQKAKEAKQQQAVQPTRPVKAQPANKWQTFKEAYPGLIEELEKISGWHSFANSLVEGFIKWGSLTEKQVIAGRAALARVAEKAKERAAAREAKTGEISVEAIEKMFATARANGLKKPRFITARLEISAAPEHGRNPGALYVKCDGAYSGKIVGGKLLPTSSAPADIVDMVREIAAAPVESARRYGKSTGVCSCCGRQLTDPKSVAAGIGPICVEKWGL